MNCLAIIPARGGSKRFPRKNIAPLGGRPLIAWSVAAARESGVCQRVIVSTDDPEIAEAGRASGAEVPFLRPAELARDNVPNQGAVDHALAWLAEHDRYVPDAVLNLQPTSPLRSGEDIRAAVDLLVSRDAGSVIGVTACDTPAHLLRQIEPDGGFSSWRAAPPPETPAHRMPLYQINGAIYLDRNPLRAGAPALAYLMPPERSLDIDSPWDLRLAEAVLSLASS